jgi:hypothetical protein
MLVTVTFPSSNRADVLPALYIEDGYRHGVFKTRIPAFALREQSCPKFPYFIFNVMH